MVRRKMVLEEALVSATTIDLHPSSRTFVITRCDLRGKGEREEKR